MANLVCVSRMNTFCTQVEVGNNYYYITFSKYEGKNLIDYDLSYSKYSGAECKDRREFKIYAEDFEKLCLYLNTGQHDMFIDVVLDIIDWKENNNVA